MRVGDDDAIVDLFRTHSPNAVAFELAKEALPGVFRAILMGAQIRGAGGVPDRNALFRILGAPWTPSSSTRQEIVGNLDALADRLVRAVTRREARLAGREPVTIEVEPEPEPQPEAA